jgi:hydrogenase maturation protein HypF
MGLAGQVNNDSEGVLIEVEGTAAALQEFTTRLVTEAPPLARIFSVESMPVEPTDEDTFRITESQAEGKVRTFVSPDIAVCDECVVEMLSDTDRRFRYPFINCTNCGPRFTITIRLPYDRPHTTMAAFVLCPECETEYNDPSDRRFHAQPIACPICGPRLWFDGPGGKVEGTDAALAAAHEALARGDIVAIKGLGGYHLACDATSGPAIDRLRRRKNRMEKPFAVMVGDLAMARSLAQVDEAEAALLSSRQRPIVLLHQRADGPVAPQVTPHNPLLGILLPYTPVHHLLFAPVPGSSAPLPQVLVMTSGNLADEPICYDDVEVRGRLGHIADGWLIHDRPIHVPCDDSVVRVEDGQELPLRRSRGYAPLPVRLPFASAPTLAMGGELKNTFCLSAGPDAFMSQHIGDMGSLETLAAFERSIRQFREMYQIDPGQASADDHPNYQTRRWAEDVSGLPVAPVQHHHAHIAAVMAEHAVPSDCRVIGFAFDGTGYGTDGAIWGGEVLLAGYNSFDRAAHLRYVPLPGGDATIRKPYRAALAHLWGAGIPWAPDLAPVQYASKEERAVVRRQLERNFGCVPTSSMGRLFDAVSSLLGVQHISSYEAQAAMELEWAAEHHTAGARTYRFDSQGNEIDPAPVLHALVDDLRRSVPVEEMAAGFHLAVARLVADVADRLHQETGIDKVALSGGVFQNVLLVRLTRDALRSRGLGVLTHRLVPPNDGGLALGQAAVAGYRAARHPGA